MRKLKSVLLIDDNNIDVFVIKKLLDFLQIAEETASVGTGLEACEFLDIHYDRHNRFPDLIIIDLFMPIMNGFEFIERLSEDPRYDKSLTQIIILTSSHECHDDKSRLSKHIDCKYVLKKPLRIEDLEMAMRQI